MNKEERLAELEIDNENLHIALRELRIQLNHAYTTLDSAWEALKKSASRTYDSTTKIFEPNAAAQWLDEHPEK